MSALPSAWVPGFAVVQQLVSRGVSYTSSGAVLASQLLPTDALGTVIITLQNVVVGSRYQLEDYTTGAVVASGEAAASTIPLSLSYYSPSQTLRVKVRKASAAPLYKIFETQVTVGASAQSVFVSQVPD